MPDKNDLEMRSRSFAAAEKLRQQLEAWLRGQGQIVHTGNCGCGACGNSRVEFIGINIPRSYSDEIDMWTHWTCNMVDERGRGWSEVISRHIPCLELYPMFQNAFAGIDVKLSQPHRQ